jgi:hypothetical protein
MAVAAVSPMGRHGWVRLYATATLDALERGDLSGARRAVSDAADAAARYGDCPSCGALLHPLAAEAAAGVGDVSDAGARADAAAEVAAQFDSAAWRAMAETAAAWAAVATGNRAGAHRRFVDAAVLYDEARQPFWAARARLSAALAGDPSAHPGPVLLAEAAATAFGRLGARRAEQRARRVVAG